MLQELDTTISSPYVTPGCIGGGERETLQSRPTKDIWSDGEAAEKNLHEYDDPRPEPEYDVIFKQSVGTEEVYLGMGAKNPTTASCENLLVKKNFLAARIDSIYDSMSKNR